MPAPMEDLEPFAKIHAQLERWKYENQESGLIEAVALMQQHDGFVRMLRADPSVKAVPRSQNDLLDRCSRFMYWLLFAKRLRECSVLLWGEDLFTPRPHFCDLIWEGIRNHNLINILGGSSCSKTYSTIAWAILDWLCDPEWTCILCVGPDSDHLSRNMWADLARLHDGSVIKPPGILDSEALSCNKLRGMGFHSIALDRGERDSAKLKGAKVKARDGPAHAIYGRDTRLRVLVNEAQEVPPNIFKQIINLRSNEGDLESLKIIMDANPADEYSEYGKNCVPFGGFGVVREDTETWTSTTGWWCIRLNAMRCENVLEGRIIYPRLVDQKKVQTVITACGGDDQHPDVWTFVYGMFRPRAR